METAEYHLDSTQTWIPLSVEVESGSQDIQLLHYHGLICEF